MGYGATQRHRPRSICLKKEGSFDPNDPLFLDMIAGNYEEWTVYNRSFQTIRSTSIKIMFGHQDKQTVSPYPDLNGTTP
jgi:hypothetical protein